MRTFPTFAAIPFLVRRSYFNAKRFATSAFTLPVSTILAFIAGTIWPLLLPFLDRARFAAITYDGPHLPVMGIVVAACVLGLIYWRTQRGNFVWCKWAIMGVLAGLVLFSVAVEVSYYRCFQWHICMDGHLAHPPYTTDVYINDAMWVLGLVASPIVLLRCRSNLSLIVSMLAGIILCSRFICGSYGGRYWYF